MSRIGIFIIGALWSGTVFAEGPVDIHQYFQKDESRSASKNLSAEGNRPMSASEIREWAQKVNTPKTDASMPTVIAPASNEKVATYDEMNTNQREFSGRIEKEINVAFFKSANPDTALPAISNDHLNIAGQNLPELAATMKQVFALNGKTPSAATRREALQLETKINSITNKHGVYVMVEHKSKEGRLMMNGGAFTILEVRKSNAFGQRFDTFVVNKLYPAFTRLGSPPEGSQLHAPDSYRGVTPIGGKVGLVISDNVGNTSNKIQEFGMGVRNKLAFTYGTRNDPNPSLIKGVDPAAAAKIDQILKPDIAGIENKEHDLIEGSVATHETFHVLFSENGGEERVRMNEGPDRVSTVHEQGAYLFQVARSDSKLTKMALLNVLEKSLGSGTSTASGTKAAVRSL